MGRNEKESPNDYCRICKRCFKTFSGNFKKIVHDSSESLFKPSQRKESFGIVLAELCEKIGAPLVRSSNYSTKVCKPCSRKIKKAAELQSELKSSVNVVHLKFQQNLEKVNNSNEKRKLSTPDRGLSPANRKSIRIKSPTINNARSKFYTNRKRLFGSDDEDDALPRESVDPTTQNPQTDSDEVLSKLNIDGLKTCEGRSCLKMKVLLVHPNGNVVTRNPTNQQTVQIIRNLIVGGWTAVANAVFDHSNETFQQELRDALQRKVNKEFQSYSKTDTVLKATSPDELIAFSNKLVVRETKVYCPLWNACITGAVGVKDNENPTDMPVNEVALATAVVARARNPKMSAVAYRISNLLLHSGATFQDITRLNKLGVCMCPKSTIEIQRSMGKHCDAKVLNWKSSIEYNKNAILFLNEILERQTPLLEKNSMDLESEFDLREVNVQSYKHFNRNVYKKLVQTLITCSADEQTISHAGALSFSKEMLQCEIHNLESKNLPLYK